MAGTLGGFALPNDPAHHRFTGFSPRFWALVVLTGIGAGLGAGALMKLLQVVEHLCYSYQSGMFLDGVEHAPVSRRAIVMAIAGVVTAAGVFLLKRSPGSGAGEVNERIWFHSGLISEWKTVAQAMLSVTIIGMGTSLGRESAPKQTGAAIASWLSRRVKLSSAESRLLVACGTGAGMGAVYNVPLGGALFSLEVLLGTLALPLIPPALASSVIATVIAWTMLPDQPTYTIGDYSVTASQLIWSVGFGPVAGLASVLWIRSVVFAEGLRPKRSIAMALPVPVLGGLGLLSAFYPQLLGNGKDVVDLALSARLGLPLLLALMILKPLVTAACLGSGAPGGLFTPTITFGALLGGLLGQAWSLFWPGAAPESYVVIGATAVLAASMQSPIAAVVLLIELTRHSAVLLAPILFAVAGAAVTARRLDPRSIYSGRIHTGKRAAATKPLGFSPAFDYRVGQGFEVISAAASYPEVLERFARAGGQLNCLYVLDDQARLAGRIPVQALANPNPLTPVLSTAAACDLMVRTEPLDARLPEAEALVRLNREPSGELPVVDPDSGELLGVVKRGSALAD